MVIATRVMPVNTKQSQNILIIQNDLNIHEVLNDGLRLDGYTVIIAEDESEASRVLDTIPLDMVILETVTADAHSLHLLDSVKLKSDVPVIIITPDIETETLKEMFEHGADDIVYRPLNMRSFVARVHAIMRRWYNLRQDIVTTKTHHHKHFNSLT
jgi:two-component system OmpR family response regulator